MNVVRSRIPMLGIVLIAVVVAGASVVATPLEAQRPTIRKPAAKVLVVDEVASIFVPFGPITQVEGLSATARAATKRGGDGTSVTGNAATTATALEFRIPSALQGRVEEGQPVWADHHHGLVRFGEFPIRVPNTRTVVARGAFKGKLTVETRELMVSNSGLISGRTKVLSEDVTSGFTGAAWVRLLDADGNEVDGFEVMCLGVNARSGDEKAWQVEIPKERAVRVRDVELWHMKSSCGRDRVDAFLDDAAKAAEVAGTVVEVAATLKGAFGGP